MKLQSLVDVDIQVDASNRQAIPVRPGGRLCYSIGLTNVGTEPVEWSETHSLNLSYRWLSEDGQVVGGEGRRTFLHVKRLVPGERHDLNLLGEAPDDAGLYQLQVSLVLEGVHWACDVSSTGWSSVLLQLSSPPAWPEDLRSSVGGRALRGALLASELDRILAPDWFTERLPPSAVSQLEPEDLSESSQLGGRKRSAWRRKVGIWLRGALGVEALQNQVEDVLAAADRQERLTRELERQILLLREDLGLATATRAEAVLEVKKNSVQPRKSAFSQTARPATDLLTSSASTELERRVPSARNIVIKDQSNG